jgi:MFS-type transporter involved in bile tolerance (Atg22 family)
MIAMMKRLQGRNLAHPGCLVGITTGLTLGIILAGILAVNNLPLNTVLLIWLGLVLLLGALGWIIGDRLTSRFSAPRE